MVKEQPLVSVVMPSYNHAEYVGKAIESVLNQTYINFEFIIADDGSTDNSVEIIKSYHDPRIKLKIFEKNTGFGANEYVYKHATGQFISAICSDDLWEADFLEKSVNFLLEHQQYGCTFCRPHIIDNQGNVLREHSFYNIFDSENMSREQWFKRLYLNGNCICAPSMCIRKELYDQLGHMKFQYRQLQDYEYWMRLLQITNIYIHPESLICYRVHQEGNNCNISTPSTENSIRDLTERKYIMFEIMDKLEQDFFVKAFSDKLIYQPSDERFCLECEKFGVMLTSRATPPIASIEYGFKYYDDSKFKFCMENYYGVDRKAFWEMTGQDYDKIIENEKNKQQVQQLTQIVCQLQQEIQRLTKNND